jgi:cytosine/adenosine deaminase-related metal-dependent hydrolase
MGSRRCSPSAAIWMCTDHYQPISARAVFAHGVHLCDAECQRLAATGSVAAFCPTSNLFGSGLSDLNKLEQHGVPGLTTKWGWHQRTAAIAERGSRSCSCRARS